MKFFRSKKKPTEDSDAGPDIAADSDTSADNVGMVADEPSNDAQKPAEPKGGLFQRLSKTRQSFASGLASLFRSSKAIDEDWYEEIEDQLILSDMGAQTSYNIVTRLRTDADRMNYRTSDRLLESLRGSLVDILTAHERTDEQTATGPHVVLMVGVNGVGKTTTIAKIANQYKQSGQSVMLAACDTFRAAAIEQLQTWGQQMSIPVIAQSHGADAAAVAFDAYNAASARGVDVLIIDTAGRQHTHGDLMEQLKKVKRVLTKANDTIPHEVLLTVDAGNGQNIHSQVESFNDTVGVTGLCVTKLDGTAKGGVVVSVVEKSGIPVKYVGVGEKVGDLKPFDAVEFVDALLPEFSSERSE